MFSHCAFLLWETPSLSLYLKPLKWVFVLVSVNDFKSDNTDIKKYIRQTPLIRTLRGP